MIENCEKPAAQVKQRSLSVGTGQTSLVAPWEGADISSLRNDIWLCVEHAEVVNQCELLIKKKKLPITILYFLLAGWVVTVLYLIFTDRIDLFSVPAVVSAILIGLLFSFINRFAPAIYQEAGEKFFKQLNMMKREEYCKIGGFADRGFLKQESLPVEEDAAP
jgi:hypothetical protein